MKGSAKAQSNRICGLISSLFSKNCTHGPLNNPYFVHAEYEHVQLERVTTTTDIF